MTASNLSANALTPRRSRDQAAVAAPRSAPASADGAAVNGASADADWPWLQAAMEMAWRSQAGLPVTPQSRDCAWTAMPRVARRTAAPGTRSVATARAFTLRTLQKWGADLCCEDASSVVTELMTNALQHALPDLQDGGTRRRARPIRLGLADAGPYVICAVADPSPDQPTQRQPDWQDEAGRGLLVVEALSDLWGCAIAPSGQGKVVWAALAAPSRSS